MGWWARKKTSPTPHRPGHGAELGTECTVLPFLFLSVLLSRNVRKDEPWEQASVFNCQVGREGDREARRGTAMVWFTQKNPSRGLLRMRACQVSEDGQISAVRASSRLQLVTRKFFPREALFLETAETDMLGPIINCQLYAVTGNLYIRTECMGCLGGKEVQMKGYLVPCLRSVWGERLD